MKYLNYIYLILLNIRVATLQMDTYSSRAYQISNVFLKLVNFDFFPDIADDFCHFECINRMFKSTINFILKLRVIIQNISAH
jgi:hypothetical protein